MADLESALANVPGLAGYLGQEQFTQRRNTAQLANANQAATLQQHFDGLNKERGLRQALGNLGPNASEDQLMQAVSPYIGADTAFKAIEARKAREASLKQTAVLQGQRIDSQMQRFREEMDRLKLPEAQRRRAETEYKMKIQGANAENTLPSDILSRYGLAGGAAPQQGGSYNFGGGKTGPLESDPTDAQAIEMWKASGNAQNPTPPQPITAPQGAPAPAVATPQPAAPAEAPVAPPTQPVAPPQAPVQGAPVARGEAPPPVGAPVARLPDLPKPPPELEATWARLGRKEADKQRAQWMAKNIGSSQLDESSVKVAAWEKLLYGTDIKGMGNASSQQRAQVANERARIGRELGLTDTEMAMLPQDNKVKMKAVDKLTTWGSFVDKAADQIIPSIDLAMDYAKKLNPGTLQSLNKAILAGKTEFNNPDANAYAVAVNTVRREYGRLMSGPTSNAMLPVEAMKHADQLVSTAMDIPTWNAVKDVIVKDAGFTKDAVQKQITALRGTIANPVHGGAPVARFETGRVYTDAKGRKAKYLGEGKWEEQ